MAIQSCKNMMKQQTMARKQQTRAWKARDFMIFGFFIACISGILINIKVAKSKPDHDFEPESAEELLEQLVRKFDSLTNKTMSPTQNCHFATSEGRRSHQEDQVTCDLNLKIPLFGRNDLEDMRVGAVAVFDGHIGSSASSMASRILLDKFMLKLNNSVEPTSDLKEILKSSLVTTINDIDAEFSEVARKYHLYAGSTAVVALIYKNHVLVANVGDSKAFLCSKGKMSHEAGAASLAGLLAKELTSDHNAHRLDEKARIEASGGVFTSIHNFVPLLMGHFPMTRAIGDVPLKRYGIIADPEVTDWLSLTSEDEFLVVASDGIFERLTPQAVCDFLNEVQDHSDPSVLARQLIQKAYLEGSNDNLSVVLVPLASGGPLLDDLSAVSCSTGM